MNSGKLVITGAAGFVGANLAMYALKNRFEVHALVKKSTNLWRLNNVKNAINFHYTDLSNLGVLKKTFKKIAPNFIFHLASYGTHPSEKDDKQTILSNIFGTYNLLEASRNINYHIFVNTGSSSEYGSKKKPMKENAVLEPITFYGATKSSATLLCSMFAHVYKKPIITLRLFSVYGPYEEPTRLIPTAIKTALIKKTLRLTSGSEKHDFVYIDDVVKAYFLAAKKNRLHGEIFNLGTGKQFTNQQVAQILNRILRNKLSFELDTYPARPWDTNYWVADIKKAALRLGWQPKYTLKEGLKLFCSWMSKNLNSYK